MPILMINTAEHLVPAVKAWCKSNDIDPWVTRPPVFVDTDENVIYFHQVVSPADDVGNSSIAAYQLSGYGLKAPAGEETGLLSVARQLPVKVQPPAEIVVGNHA